MSFWYSLSVHPQSSHFRDEKTLLRMIVSSLVDDTLSTLPSWYRSMGVDGEYSVVCEMRNQKNSLNTEALENQLLCGGEFERPGF